MTVHQTYMTVQDKCGRAGTSAHDSFQNESERQ